MIFDVLETDEDIDHVTISTKEKFNSEIRDYEQLVKASISFKDYQSSLTSYEKMRKAYLNDKKVKMLLNFTHAEINSYISLFSSGLEKPEDLSEKLFEN